ncbi:MAG: hypothetical protein U1E23_01465 [Reyranellaceae bacterium]
MKGLITLLAVLTALSGSGALLASGASPPGCVAGAGGRDATVHWPADDVGRPEALARALWRQRLADGACR